MIQQSNPNQDSTPLIDGGAIFDLSNPESFNSDEYEMPEEIQTILEENDLSKRSFRVTLKHIPEGGNTGDGDYVTSWSRKIPSIEYIARNWGPGEYIFLFQWKAKDKVEDKQKNWVEKLPITISEKYRDIYEDFQFQKKIQRATQKRTLVQNERLKKQLEDTITLEPDEKQDVKSDIKEQISQISEMANLLGFRQAGSSSLPWDKIFAVAGTVLPPLLLALSNSKREAAERSEKMMLTMMSMNQTSSAQLIEVLKNQNGPTTGSEVMGEMFKTIMGAMDIKEALAGKKESVVDRVFGLIENVAPQVMSLAAMSKQQRENDFQYKMAQTYLRNSPDCKAVEGDPESLSEIVKRTDAYIGWRQTDLLLEAWGKPRPADCPRMPEQELPHDMGQESGNIEDAQFMEPGDAGGNQ